jgi:hypothetical protein
MTVSLQTIINKFRLADRQHKERFCVVDGYLEKMGFIDNLRYDLSKSFREKVQADVRQVVNTVLSGINQGGQVADLDRFLFEKIFPLSHKIFDPSTIKEGTVKVAIDTRAAQIREELKGHKNIKALSDSIDAIDREIRELEQTEPELDQDGDHWYDAVLGNKIQKLEKQKQHLEDYRERLTRAFIGLRMNLNHRTNLHYSGWSGAYFWRDYETGKTIGVYKPCDEDSLSSGSPKGIARLRFRVKKIINSVLEAFKVHDYAFFNPYQVGKAHLAESNTRRVAELMHEAYLDLENSKFKFHTESPVVPNTKIVHVDQKSCHTKPGIGSFQLFLDNEGDLTSFFAVDKNYDPQLPEMPDIFKERLMKLNVLAQYQWMLILHFLVGAQDPHAENILAVRNSRGQVELKAIDNGMGLSWTHPTLMTSKRLMQDCRLPLAEEAILPEVREMLIQFEKSGYLKTLEREIVSSYQNRDNFPPELEPDTADIAQQRYDHLASRFAVLKKMAEKRTPLSELIRLSHEWSQKTFLR